MRPRFPPLLLLTTMALVACDGAVETDTDTDSAADAEPGPPTVADLTGAVALALIHDDPALYRQLADDTFAPVLPAEAEVLGFVTTEAHAYVQLAAPFWLQGDPGGQWCTLLDVPLDAGDVVAPRCLARTEETDPDAPPTLQALPVEVHAYDERDVWVFWQVTYAENDVDYELWGYRDGAGAHAGTHDVPETSYAVEGGFVYGGELWTLDGGAPASTPLDADPVPARWGPWQFTDEEYSLFRASEGVVRLEDLMGGDPYCATYLSEDATHSFSDGPHLLVRIGTAWDDDYDVPPTYCRCTLDWDCQRVTEEQKAALSSLPAWWDVVSPLHTDGMAYVARNDALYFVHDLQVSADLGGLPTDRFFQWGHDLYFLEDIAEAPDVYSRVDWSGGEPVVTALPAYEYVKIVRI